MVFDQHRVPCEDESGEQPEQQRLHRRDTPHHLKNKRINQQVSFSVHQVTVVGDLIYQDMQEEEENKF